MAISLTAKVDFLFKKLGFGVARTDSDSLKGPTNESIASPLLNRGDKTLVQANLIPATLPASTTGVVEVYSSSNLVEAVADGTASANRTWITGVTDWIPPEFGSTYQVKVYLHDSGDSDNAAGISNQLFAAGSGNDDEWFFDYQSGVLHFMGENLPNGKDFTDKSIYISGGQYIGILGVGSAGFDSDQVIEIIRENGLRVLEIPSDSDLKVVADLSNNVNTITARLDSDSSFIQALATQVKSRLDSDDAALQALSTSTAAAQARADAAHVRLDSESTKVQLLKTNLTSRLDSDSLVVQALKTAQDIIHTRIDSDRAALDSRVSDIRLRLDSEAAKVSVLQSQMRLRLDSEGTKLSLLQSQVRARLDSDHNLFQDKIRSIVGIGDSDLAVAATLRNEVDGLRADIDSETTRMTYIQSLAGRIKSDMDSDFVHFTSKVGSSGGASDSDINVLTNKINLLRSDRDSDEIAIQALGTLIGTMQGDIAKLNTLIGVTSSSTPATPVPTDSENLATVTFSTDSDQILEAQMSVTWRVVSGDGSTVSSNTMIFAKGSSDANILRVLAYNLESHPVAKGFFNTLLYRDSNVIEYAFKDKFSLAEYKLTFTINSHGGDNPRFTNTLPTGS